MILWVLIPIAVVAIFVVWALCTVAKLGDIAASEEDDGMTEQVKQPPEKRSRPYARKLIFDKLMRTKYRACGVGRLTWMGKAQRLFFKGDQRPRRVRREMARVEAKAIWRGRHA